LTFLDLCDCDAGGDDIHLSSRFSCASIEDSESVVRKELWRWMGRGELSTCEPESFVIETASISTFWEDEDDIIWIPYLK